MRNILKVIKSWLKGRFWARKHCYHCDEDFDNLCMSWTLGCPNRCNLFSLFVWCPGRKKEDDRWIF